MYILNNSFKSTVLLFVFCLAICIFFNFSLFPFLPYFGLCDYFFLFDFNKFDDFLALSLCVIIL